MDIEKINDVVRDDARYVKKAGDTMTGPLVVTPVTGETAITANKNIILKSGQKLIFDGV